MDSKLLKSKLLIGIIWNALEKLSVKGITFVLGVILARILSPHDYGIIGMLAFFISVSNVFIEGGLAKALIQKKQCTELDYSTAFYANLFSAILIYLILFISAPLIASFYEEPLLVDITRILSLKLLLGSFNLVQRAKLMVAMDFKSLAMINFIGTLFGGILGICLAYCGYGVWALVWQIIAATLTMSILFPFYSKWSPSLVFSMLSFKQLFTFGSKLLISGVLAIVVNNISTLCIGKMYKSTQLGYYTRATQFSDLIAYTVYDILGSVTFPALSQLQDDRDKMLLVYKQTLHFTALVIFPVMILMALLARPLVIVLLTEKWLPCVLLLQILCIARMFTPLSAVNMNILNAIGRSDLFLKLDMVKILYYIIILVITIPLGVKAIVIGNLIYTFIGFFVNAYLPGKLFGYGAIKQIRDWGRIFLALLAMVASVCLFIYFVSSPFFQLFGGVCIGSVIYIYIGFRLKIIDLNFKQLFKNVCDG